MWLAFPLPPGPIPPRPISAYSSSLLLEKWSKQGITNVEAANSLSADLDYNAAT